LLDRPMRAYPHPLQKTRGVIDAAGAEDSLSLGMKQGIVPARA